MDKPRVRRGEVAGIPCYGVELDELWVPCGTWEEAMGWAEHLVRMNREAEQVRVRQVRGPGDWIIGRPSLRGSMWRRNPGINHRYPWTSNPERAYGWATMNEAMRQMEALGDEAGMFVTRRTT